MVEPEEVCGVVRVLECDESLEAVSCLGDPDAVGPFVIEVVDVDGLGRKRPHRVQNSRVWEMFSSDA